MASKGKRSNPESGSPSGGEPEYLMVGHLRRPHGVLGEMVMEVHTDFPERLKPASQVYVGAGHRLMTILRSRAHPEGMIIQFDGIDTPEAAGTLRNQWVFVSTADRPELPEGMYYHHQLIGFAVVDDQEAEIGTLQEIMQTGANDVYIVARPDGKEVLLPVISSVVLGVDPARRRIRVHLLPGLVDETG